MRIRSYTELRRLDSYEERFSYLRLGGQVGRDTFGFDRYLNQMFYQSREWRDVRHKIILRDGGCDLGIPGWEIYDRIYIHHMNPMTANDILRGNEAVLDPEFLITVTHKTHNAIHYGDGKQLPRLPIERRPGDTKLW